MNRAQAVPLWVRILTGLIAVLNVAYGVLGYIAPAGQPLTLAARNTAIGLAILLVTFVGVPETLAITMIIRFLIEGQDLVLQVLSGGVTARALMPLGFMVAELVVIVTMFRLVDKLERSSAS